MRYSIPGKLTRNVIPMLFMLIFPSISFSVDEQLAGESPWRRLFLDATVVEESENLQRVFHSVERHPSNPVMVKDKPWEGFGPYLYGTVLRVTDTFEMWYTCIGKGSGFVCYATSEDGLSWNKPELGLFEYEGSRANNIVAKLGMPSVVKVPDPGSAERAWMLFAWGAEKGPVSVFSPDRRHWQLDDMNEKLFSSNDVVNCFLDPYKDRLVATYKTMNRRHRAVGVAFSDDGINWDKPVEGAVFGADDLDPDATQVYGMPVFPYQGLFIGMPWIYHSRYTKYGPYTVDRLFEAEDDSPRTVDVQLAWGWDLINWTRTPNRQPFIPLGEEKWDSKMIYTARAPVIVGDQLFFYYGGFDTLHDVGQFHGSIGLATLRLDGFCSMQAGEEEGWLISRREVFSTPRVHINATIREQGYIVAEIVDIHNRPLEGFSRDDCVCSIGDSTASEMIWEGKGFPKEFVNSEKKIRFYLKNADIYSYLPADIDVELDKGNRDPR